MKKRYLLLIVVAVLLLVYLYPRVLEMRGVFPKKDSENTASESQSQQVENQQTGQGSVGTGSTTTDNINAQGPGQQAVAVTSSPLPKLERETAIIDFMTSRYPGKWDVIMNDNGTVNAVHGGHVPELGKSADQIHGFLQQLAPLMGIESNQIQNTKLHHETGMMHSYSSDQVVDGYTVFNGVVRVSVRKEDGAIIAVDSMLREIGPYNRNATLARDAAFVIIMKKYGEANTRVLKGDDKPVLYAHEPDKTQLAWRFEVEVKAVPQKRVLEVLVGFQSKTVIYENPMLVN